MSGGKRALDVGLAAGGLLLTAPLLAAAALAIRWLDGPPAFFVQERVGRGRHPFRVVKLRTMRDGRVTRVGAVLRATGIDELPQLAHVLLGDMSLVGPRPLTAADVSRLGWDARRFDARWRVRPGLTGPAQLHGGRCDARITWVYDRAYVARNGVARDAGILGTSGLCLVLGKRRVRSWLAGRGTVG